MIDEPDRRLISEFMRTATRLITLSLEIGSMVGVNKRMQDDITRLMEIAAELQNKPR